MVKENRTSMERAADAEDPNCDMDECRTCGSPIILPMAFCVWCMSSLRDMVIQLNGFDDIDYLKERIGELEDELED